MLVRIKEERHSGRYRQGSGTAEFLLCTNCGVLVGVLYRDDGRIHAAVNTKAIDGGTSFGAEQPVSPKMLSDSEKVKRWRDVWFSDVLIVTGEA